jgi:hypothetical protein
MGEPVRTTATVIAAFLLLASCNDRPPANESGIDNAAIAINAGLEESETLSPASPGSSEDASGTAAAPAATTNRIPPAFHGRWGLVPGDCGPDAGAAKGLLTITGDMLRFYESVGKPETLSLTGLGRLEGRFAFSGEGMDWSKALTLSLEGNKLVRSEHDPEAAYTYTRCPA